MIRDVLERLVNHCAYRKNVSPKNYRVYKKEAINQALKEIQEEVIKGLPKKRKKKLRKFPGSDVIGKMNWAYNQYRQEAIEGIKGVSK